MLLFQLLSGQMPYEGLRDFGLVNLELSDSSKRDGTCIDFALSFAMFTVREAFQPYWYLSLTHCDCVQGSPESGRREARIG